MQGIETAMLASGDSLSMRVLADLTTAAAAAGDLPLAAHTLGALEASGQPQASPDHSGPQTAVPPDLVTALYAPACATYLEEGRAGGASLIITLYPR